MKLDPLELSLGTALALASFASGPDEVRYAPEKGLKVTRTCETSGELELGSESVTYDGEERLQNHNGARRAPSRPGRPDSFSAPAPRVAAGGGPPRCLSSRDP